MNNKKLEKQIIDLIPSKTIKKEVEKQKHQFTDLELIQIIINFAENWDKIIEYLSSAKEYIEDEKINNYINEYIQIENKQYELLTSYTPNYVYEVDMNPNSLGDKYLCPNYESTYITIKTFEETYDQYMSIKDKTNIEIYKRRVAVRSEVDDIDEVDNLVHATLNPNKEIIRIYSNLDHPNIDIPTIRYPNTFKEGDLVYIDINKFPEFRIKNIYKNKRYGINSFDNVKEFNGEVDECCFLDLANEYVKYRKIENNKKGYCDYLMCHTHLDYGYLEKVDINTINVNIKNDYDYVVKTLKSLGYIKK